MGTQRLLTSGTGEQAGQYASYPFGDGLAVTGTDINPYHFGGLDHDYETGLDHAQYREYANPGGRWLSPDPYRGSYDFANPQSLNRYAYALNDPLSGSDPSGLDGEGGNGGFSPGGCIGAVASGGLDIPGDKSCLGSILDGLDYLFGGGPSFHGSLKPRPNAQPWDEGNIHYGPNIAGALGLPDDTCEFGPCGGGLENSFTDAAQGGGQSWRDLASAIATCAKNSFGYSAAAGATGVVSGLNLLKTATKTGGSTPGTSIASTFFEAFYPKLLNEHGLPLS